MGWWKTSDGTVIGDEFADVVDSYKNSLISDLRSEFPAITRSQIHHTIAFCMNYIEFDDNFTSGNPSMLVVMPYAEREERSSGICDPGEDAIIEGMSNVKNPFEKEGK